MKLKKTLFQLECLLLFVLNRARRVSGKPLPMASNDFSNLIDHHTCSERPNSVSDSKWNPTARALN